MRKQKKSVIAVLRTWFHDRLRAPVDGRHLYCYVSKQSGTKALSPVPTNADKDNYASVLLTEMVAEKLKVAKPPRTPVTGQAAGSQFEAHVRRFLQGVLKHLTSTNAVRPGCFVVEQVSRKDRLALAKYEQYAHLRVVHEFKEEHPKLAAALGSDYLVSSDVVVARAPSTDAEINAGCISKPYTDPLGKQIVRELVDENVARRTRLRAANTNNAPLLHATVSCKWTLRSDRSQNVRVESQNVSRNRKGNQPQIVVVTAECLPSRLVSVALSTGDIDSVYHFALDELITSMTDAHDKAKADLDAAEAHVTNIEDKERALGELRRRLNLLNKRKARLEARAAVPATGGSDDSTESSDVELDADLNTVQQEYELKLHERQGLDLRSAKARRNAKKRDFLGLADEQKHLTMLVDGNRLKDISDLPFDLMV